MQPSAVDPFLASLQGVLTLKFPLGSPGDPYQSSSAQTPTITSVVSLLALAPAQGAIALQAPLVTPLAIVTHLLPKLFEPLPSSVIPTHLRGGSNDKSAVVRRKTFATETVLKKVVVFLPAVGTLQGPGLTSPKVTNDAVRTAFKTLAAEISTAAANTFDGEQPCGVRVEVVDLGFVNAKRRAEVEWKAGVAKAMQVLGQRWAGWLKSWVGGRRVWSGFEVLERAMMRTLTAGGSAAGGANRVLGLGVLGGWARRGVGHVGATGTYGQIRVGAGCELFASYICSRAALTKLDPCRRISLDVHFPPFPHPRLDAQPSPPSRIFATGNPPSQPNLESSRSDRRRPGCGSRCVSATADDRGSGCQACYHGLV